MGDPLVPATLTTGNLLHEYSCIVEIHDAWIKAVNKIISVI